MKKKESNRFSHLANDLKEFKAGKTKIRVTTLVGGNLKVRYESYEQMKARHEAREQAAFEFKMLRQDMALSQADLAQALRVPRRTLEGWESGRFPINPTAEVLARVMKSHPRIKNDLTTNPNKSGEA